MTIKQDALTEHERQELNRMVEKNHLGSVLAALMDICNNWASLYEITEDEPEQRSWERDAAKLQEWYKDVEN